MNKILKLTVILFLICAITAGVLGVVNHITKPIIDEQAFAATRAAYSAVLDIGEGIPEELAFDSADPAFSTVDKVSRAANGAGHVVELTVSGAQGLITLAVGVDNDLKCTGISIISHSETSGLGANAAADSEIGRNFRAQFVGQGEDIALKKNGGEIDHLTGATITSNAVTGAVATAIQVVKSLG